MANSKVRNYNSLIVISGSCKINVTANTRMHINISDFGFKIPTGYTCIAIFPQTESNGAMWYQMNGGSWAMGLVIYPYYTMSNLTVYAYALCMKT